jgi:hypothetical protein
VIVATVVALGGVAMFAALARTGTASAVGRCDDGVRARDARRQLRRAGHSAGHASPASFTPNGLGLNTFVDLSSRTATVGASPGRSPGWR